MHGLCTKTQKYISDSSYSQSPTTSISTLSTNNNTPKKLKKSNPSEVNIEKTNKLLPHSESPKKKNKNILKLEMNNITKPLKNKLSTKPTKNEEFKFSRKGFVLSFTGNLEDFYNISPEPLGKGTYGCVYKATDKILNIVRAVKAVSKKKLKNIPRFRQEIDIMKSLDHPNVIKLYETFEDDNKIYLVMELCSGGELFDKIVKKGFFTEKYACFIMKQIFGVVNYLHLNNIAHRDLKPENFLFFDKSPESLIKIIDFGLASYFTEENPEMKTKAGTPYYVAPQVLNGCFDKKCDIWSIGVLFYILLCGYPPFYGDTDNDILRRVKKGVFDFKGKEWKNVSNEAKDLIKCCLTMDPNKRISASEALKHPWFKMKTSMFTLEAKFDNRVLENFKSYGFLLKLQKLAVTIIAQQVNDIDLQKLKSAFLALDEDGLGYITKEQMRKGLENSGLKLPNNFDVLVETIDSDGSGQIDYTEFVAAALDRKHFSKQLLYCAFRVFDVDNDGKITTAELAHILYNGNKKKYITQMDVDKVKKMIKEVDKNNDGNIDFHEFSEMMQIKC